MASEAYHSLHLFSELLVQQGIYKRIDSRVEEHHRVRNGNRDFTNAVGCEVPRHVGNLVCTPTDCKDGTDSYDHQRDSFPHPKDTLCNYNEEQRIKLSVKVLLKRNFCI